MVGSPGELITEIMDFWKDGWEGRKDKMRKKVQQVEVQERWKKHGSSASAEKSFAEEVQKAIATKSRAKGIEAADAATWASEYVNAVGAKTLTVAEKERFGRQAGPFIAFVKRVRTAYRESGLHGIEGGKFWLQEIAARLATARKHPELLSKIEAEIMELLRRKAVELGVKV